VNGPSPDSVSASPAAWTALTSVEKSGLAEATSTIVSSLAGSVSLAIDVSGAVAGEVSVLASDESSSDEQAPSTSAPLIATQANAQRRLALMGVIRNLFPLCGLVDDQLG
jgi:hypothetical protein